MEQQAWILRSFVADLERQEAVGEEAPNGIAGEFARLKNQSTKYRTDKTYPTKTADKQENIKKNRYKDIVPFDHSRVKLTLITSKNDTDYINASFIKGVSGTRAYIATQGPLPHTVVDFLRMLWEYKMEVVVMACREFEMGKKKCEVYWPKQQEAPFICEPFTVYCDSEESKGDYLTRTLRLTYRNCSRTLKQLHYINWPDHGVPDSIPPILDMLHEMRSYQPHDDIPICIHCSAGCGRTGALCVIDYTWNLLKKQMITSDFSIYNLVQCMRTQRPSVVQTKEQYELVYRTIKVLFQTYLESIDEETCQNEVTIVQSISENELTIPSENFDLPQFQHLLNEERGVLSQYNIPLAASANLISLSTEDIQTDQQHWHLFQTPSEALTTTQNLKDEHWMAPKMVHTNQNVSATEERIQESDDRSLNCPPSPTMAAAICLMVEDPYFESAMSSPSSDEVPVEPTENSTDWTLSPIFNLPTVNLNGQTLDPNAPASDTVEVQSFEENPPPLPERTPESYLLAEDTEVSDRFERLSVIPQNDGADGVSELGGSPPSPAPPLPERTPESFELAIDPAPVEQKLEVKPPVNLSLIGISSEWSGNSNHGATTFQNEAKPFERSKSLKINMTFTAPVTNHDLSPNPASNFCHFYPPLEPLAPTQLPQAENSLTPPLPERTRQSFIFATELHETTATCPQPLEIKHPSTRVGVSSEWDGTSQPKKLFDAVKKRSKSVRAKSSRPFSTAEPLTAVHQIAPPTVVMAEGGSARAEQHEVNHRAPLNTVRSENKSDRTSEKGISRTKSLKFFKSKQRPTNPPPPPPNQPGTPSPSCTASFSVFKFGFGNRFRKPGGPRKYPETWV